MVALLEYNMIANNLLVIMRQLYQAISNVSSRGRSGGFRDRQRTRRRRGGGGLFCARNVTYLHVLHVPTNPSSHGHRPDAAPSPASSPSEHHHATRRMETPKSFCRHALVYKLIKYVFTSTQVTQHFHPTRCRYLSYVFR